MFFYFYPTSLQYFTFAFASATCASLGRSFKRTQPVQLRPRLSATSVVTSPRRFVPKYSCPITKQLQISLRCRDVSSTRPHKLTGCWAAVCGKAAQQSFTVRRSEGWLPDEVLNRSRRLLLACVFENLEDLGYKGFAFLGW